jgi:hypothetical protein
MKVATCKIISVLLLLATTALEGLSTNKHGETELPESSLRRRAASPVTVTQLELINAKTDKKISDLFYGQYVNVSSIAGLTQPNFNINAVVSGPVDFVRFGYNNNPKFRSEGATPYAFCGNMGRNYYTCTNLGYGTHYVTAQAISNRTPGPLITVTFTIARI